MSFCSRLSLGSAEILAGTAPVSRAYVLLPVPKRLWGRNELNSSWAQPQDLAAIRLARQGGVVTRLYNPPRHVTPGQAKAIVYLPPAGPPPALWPLQEGFAGRFAWDLEGLPRLAVCTHGTRDRCCAKWGFAVFTEASRLFAAGASHLEPLETSHLGGDRFAATGIVFPSGSMYAHLDTVDLQALAQRELEGAILPEPYRGRVYEAQLHQIVRAGLARQGLFNDASADLKVTRTETDTANVLVETDQAEFRIELGIQDIQFFGSCDNAQDDRLSKTRRTVYLRGARVPL